MLFEALRETYSAESFRIVFLGFSFLARWAPLWLPILLASGFWRLWVTYVRAEKIAAMEWVLLRIMLPKEVLKSPLAMELVLNSLQQTFGETTFIDRYWKGGIRNWFSLEIVSLGGHVRFYMRVPKGSQALIESQIYAQYPDAEIVEDEDYTNIHYDEKTMSMWAAEFVLTEPDPYPIKTYVDYGLDRDPKEELKVDPMTPMLEWLGSLGSKELGWFQIIVRAHKKQDKPSFIDFFFKPVIFGKKGLFGSEGPLWGKVDKWESDVKGEIEKIVKGRKIRGGDEEGGPIKLTRIEEQVVEALERSISKLAFDVGIRGIYLAAEDAFRPANIGGIIGSLRAYNTNHLNGFKPRFTTNFDYPWQDFRGKRLARRKRIYFDAYRRRSFFHAPYKRRPFVLNAEELATIYHFPGRVAATPTMKRLESRKAEPPVNLPRHVPSSL